MKVPSKAGHNEHDPKSTDINEKTPVNFHGLWIKSNMGKCPVDLMGFGPGM